METKMAKRVRKITPNFLKRIVVEEARKLQSESITGGELEPTEKVDAEEVEADEYADSLEKDIDHIKVLKIQEKKLVKKIKQIRETKQRLANRIAKRV
jgi:hypothetical protein|tara:strand:- start:1127 stop:1420 length:294 start_codon:yes stop_codon:yes gene_type:complete